MNKFKEGWNKELERDPINPSLWKTIFDLTGYSIWIIIIVGLLFKISIEFFSIYALRKILQFISESDSDNPSHNVSQTAAIWYALSLFFGGVITTILNHATFYGSERKGNNAKTAMTGTIFDKSLTLYCNQVPIGQLVNLISTDVERFQNFLKMLPLAMTSYDLYFVYVHISPDHVHM